MYRFKIKTYGRRVLIGALICSLPHIVAAEDKQQDRERRFILGLGVGLVGFNTNAKFTDKESGRSIFVDAEGSLGLPKNETVPAISGIYRINKKHAITFSYTQIDREATLVDATLDIGNVTMDGRATLSDKTRFYYFNYGHTFHEDDRTRVIGLIGLYGLDLRYTFNASGDITIGGVTRQGEINEGVDVLAPLPVIGMDFLSSITRKWGFSAKIALVGGNFQDVTAGVFDTTVTARYQFNRRIGGVVGVTYFDADVTIEDSTKRDDLVYGYSGLFLGLNIPI